MKLIGSVLRGCVGVVSAGFGVYLLTVGLLDCYVALGSERLAYTAGSILGLLLISLVFFHLASRAIQPLNTRAKAIVLSISLIMLGWFCYMASHAAIVYGIFRPV
jgi:hypothetical protein